MQDLAERERLILRAVVHTVILRGRPVGSRTIARMREFSLSAATIRNIMAELEATGYLYQPHTSAGRLPTDQGYRFYVDELLESGKYSWDNIDRIDRTWLSDAANRNRQFRGVSGLLSRFSQSIGVVLAPNIRRTTFQHIEFIHIDREKTLVVFVSEGGIVHNRIIRSEREYSQPALDSMAEQLNAIFSGQNLVQVHREIVRQLSREPAEGTERMRDAFLLGRQPRLTRFVVANWKFGLIVPLFPFLFGVAMFYTVARDLVALFRTRSR